MNSPVFGVRFRNEGVFQNTVIKEPFTSNYDAMMSKAKRVFKIQESNETTDFHEKYV